MAIVSGNRAMYIRTPSQPTGAIIHPILVGNTHKDWLVELHKYTYAIHCQGDYAKYETYDNDLDNEQAMLDTILAANYGRTRDTIIQNADEGVRTYLGRRVHMPQAIHVASTPPTTQDTHAIHVAPGADGRYSDVRMHIPSVATGSTRRSRFMFDASARTNLARSSLSLPITV